ncbi:hypothetical protein Plhal304r1_c028g0092261 [Plasmopara halstedii]
MIWNIPEGGLLTYRSWALSCVFHKEQNDVVFDTFTYAPLQDALHRTPSYILSKTYLRQLAVIS